jgi:hypothetical protein
VATKPKKPTINPANLAGARLSLSPAFLKLAGKTPNSGLAGSRLQNSPAFMALAQQQAAQAAAPQAAGGGSVNGDISTADPRDSTFGAGLAGLLGQIQAQRTAIQGADQLDQQQYGENQKTLAANRATSLDNTATNANREGLFYSGQLGKRQGDVNATYDAQATGETTALQQRQQARQSQLQQIGQISADASSPYGYTATGDAGTSFYNLLRDAADRRVSQGFADTPASVPNVASGATAAGVGPTPTIAKPTGGVKLPTYKPSTPSAAKPKVAKPKAIHGSSTVNLNRLQGSARGVSLGGR